jgi:hypothetical protein
VYFYDAWNRLVSVHKQDAGGSFMVKAFSYDGLGRLIRTQSPFPYAYPDNDQGNRIERFYYDGVRRIHEVVIDPMSSLGSALQSGSSSVQQAALNAIAASGLIDESLLDEGATPVAVEAAQLALLQQTSSPGGGNNQPAEFWHLEREYIWGPGDGWGVAGTDELVCQFDRSPIGSVRPTFALTDVGGDPVALCNSTGPTTPTRKLTPPPSTLARARGPLVVGDEGCPNGERRDGEAASPPLSSYAFPPTPKPLADPA